MNAEAEEWIWLAEGDMATAQRELRARNRPNYNAACFHFHQVAEKYLKGFMRAHAIPFEKIHAFITLWSPLVREFPEFHLIREWLGMLNAYPVAARYPGLIATREQAKEAVQHAKQVRSFIRSRMGLSVEKETLRRMSDAVFLCYFVPLKNTACQGS